MSRYDYVAFVCDICGMESEPQRCDIYVMRRNSLAMPEGWRTTGDNPERGELHICPRCSRALKDGGVWDDV